VYLADTNVISELRKLNPDATVVAWLRRHEPYLHVSAITIGELQLGYRLQPHGRKKEQLRRWIEEIRRTMRQNILPMDEATAAAWGDFEGTLRDHRMVLSTTDAMIAATALHHRLILVTRDTSFSRVGLQTLDPWT
jgi:predicted nucleic acid-binding protein